MTVESAMVELHGFRAGYRGVAVVHGIDLTVAAGEVIALLGPNGAGKTTTLRTISGLLPRLGGDAVVLGEPQPRHTRRSGGLARRLVRRGVAHVPEDRALFFGLTGREHLRLAAGRRHQDEIAKAIEPFPGLARVIDRRAGLLSGGEQQMLAIARALATRPRLLLVDELSLGLAPIVVQSLLPLVGALARDLGIGVLLVEQHVGAALEVADRAYVMVRGRVVDSDAASVLAADPDRLRRSYFG
jgi:branched-chain amino acid transport system ATP-binding protein